jgi:hypothetical protein
LKKYVRTEKKANTSLQSNISTSPYLSEINKYALPCDEQRMHMNSGKCARPTSIVA